MTAPSQPRPCRATSGNVIAWRFACFRLSAGALPVDIALLPGLGSMLW